MPRKKSVSKKEPKETGAKNLEKFAIFFEHQNSKNSAKTLLWLGVFTITIGLVFFVTYNARLQINAFTWDRNTLEVKNLAEQKWAESFEEQEKEKNISEIKQQFSQILQQFTTTTTSTTAITSTTTISSTTVDTSTAVTVSSTNKK